ncbi:MAG: hypothetical protein K9K63_04870 [Desulfotignum sp.]|nr:hypothetical protein [Desulfotignum sp.]MCF8089550.1 hypothetical protein [Desulfotignum sp.]MCF8136624.1 hypothetical protein [Desulfotignum sp.]
MELFNNLTVLSQEQANVAPFLEECGQILTFPPRFGEHNPHIYGDILGYAPVTLSLFKEKGII